MSSSESCNERTAGTWLARTPPWLALATDTNPSTVVAARIATTNCQPARRHSRTPSRGAPNPVQRSRRPVTTGASAAPSIATTSTAVHE